MYTAVPTRPVTVSSDSNLSLEWMQFVRLWLCTPTNMYLYIETREIVSVQIKHVRRDIRSYAKGKIVPAYLQFDFRHRFMSRGGEFSVVVLTTRCMGTHLNESHTFSVWLTIGIVINNGEVAVLKKKLWKIIYPYRSSIFIQDSCLETFFRFIHKRWVSTFLSGWTPALN